MTKSSREVIKLLEQNGWTLSHVRGSHYYYRKSGFQPVTVPHPRKDLAIGTYKAILKHAGLL
ncbi:type II toxin-antitoxin system HicA family toxin [Proteiniclasticum sp. BAD-10]|uniref:Type II toxin-antitoxin system HicA family toxin n=1 Tax=Proteiniclasticum sediminis TaxID=2804028 RepID=A0A941CQ44_9CLOT|nr:type II toxin-antitoxin system HicA family toxin [Proteiniclasticum sediminis]MBR0575241.1 type II toxin-antitoxin system HicA family toxin [Proteiniclasticum sediminis]